MKLFILFFVPFLAQAKDVTKQQIADRARASTTMDICEPASALRKCFKDIDRPLCVTYASDAYTGCLEQVASVLKPTYKDPKDAANVTGPLVACSIANFIKTAKAEKKWLTSAECTALGN